MAEWLEAKGFNAATQRALRMPGHQLFALTRAQLEKALGADEGKRLYSQILVQRNISGVSRRLYGEAAALTRTHTHTLTQSRTAVAIQRWLPVAVQNDLRVGAAEHPPQGAREGGGLVSTARGVGGASTPRALHVLPARALHDEDDDASVC